MKDIFVQIASYRDPQLIPTLKDMVEKAKNPEALKITICWQHSDDESTELFMDAGFDIQGFDKDSLYGYNVIKTKLGETEVSLIDVPHMQSKGACWARNYIQQFYNGEKYTIQLDSHHRFVEDWDTVCIDMLEGLRAKSPKPVLTAYIPSFDPENDPAGRDPNPWKMDFDRFIPEGAVFFRPSAIEDHKNLTEPVRSRFYSAHFCFADGSFAVEVQHDPEYFFHGEEISIAARAFTHGYDLYHPHKLIAWHEYTRKNRTKVWDDHTTDKKKSDGLDLDWCERNNICHRRNRILFGMDGENPYSIDFGKYGFGKERTISEYERYAGISFIYRGVQQRVVDRKDPVWPLVDVYATEEEWRKSMTISHDLRICVHKNEYGEPLDDYDFCYIAAHDADGEIYRKDLNAAEFKGHLKHDWLDIRLIFLSDRTPTFYKVWPHSLSKGWLPQIDKPVDKHPA